MTMCSVSMALIYPPYDIRDSSSRVVKTSMRWIKPLNGEGHNLNRNEVHLAVQEVP